MPVANSQLQIWANPPSATKYITTHNRITKALKDHFGSKIEVYLQGSYKNSTNVRSESDVDIIAEYTPAFYPGLYKLTAEEKALYHRIHTDHNYNHAQFKTDVMKVLVSEFSQNEVKRGEKAIKVLKNEYRVNADVIACFTHKRFINASEHDQGAVGIHFFTDKGMEVTNFPKQHHTNGENKNHTTRTNGKYKDMVRIYKNINHKLIAAGKLAEGEIPSHFIECLVWNVPDSYFKGSYSEILKSITARIWFDMKDEEKPQDNYSYVHDLMWLFRGNVLYTPALATKFMNEVWSFAVS